MKMNVIVVIAMAMGILTIGALSASAEGPCGKRADKQDYQKFTQETAGLISVLKAKNIEMREQVGYWGIEHGYDGIDSDNVRKLETELKEIKDKINSAAQKYGIQACSHS